MLYSYLARLNLSQSLGIGIGLFQKKSKEGGGVEDMEFLGGVPTE